MKQFLYYKKEPGQYLTIEVNISNNLPIQIGWDIYIKFPEWDKPRYVRVESITLDLVEDNIIYYLE